MSEHNQTDCPPVPQDGSEWEKKQRKRHGKRRGSDSKVRHTDYLSRDDAEQGIKDGNYFSAILTIEPSKSRGKFNQEAIALVDDSRISLTSSERNRALHGDQIVIEKWNQGRAKVVHILTPIGDHHLLGTLMKKGGANGLCIFKPNDAHEPLVELASDTFDAEIGHRIRTSGFPFTVRLSAWRKGSKYPTGKLIQPIPIEDIEAHEAQQSQLRQERKNRNKSRNKNKNQNSAPRNSDSKQVSNQNNSNQNNSNQYPQRQKIRGPCGSSGGGRKDKGRSNDRKAFYEEHMNLEEIKRGLAEGTIIKGVLRIPGNINNAFVTAEGPHQLSGDVYIEGRKTRNRSFEGDVVAVLLNDKSKWKVQDIAEDLKQLKLDNSDEKKLSLVHEALAQPTGKVVGILESNHIHVVPGYIKPVTNRQARTTLFIPLDRKIPFGLLPRRNWPREFTETPDLEPTKLYTAIYSHWKATDRQPFVRIEKELGLASDIRAATTAILINNGVDYDHEGAFQPSILKEVEQYGNAWTIPLEEKKRRRDFTRHRIFSIDPTTARDLDDALHITPLGNDIYEIGVHIADVSYFVGPGTAVDREAAHRCTTIYLVQRAIPMLPRCLCNNWCSLNPGVERLAYSVVWKMRGNGTLVNERPWFGKSIIKSCGKLDYSTAQLMIEAEMNDDRKAYLGGGGVDNKYNLADFYPIVITDQIHAAVGEGTDRVIEGPHTVDQVIADVRLLNRLAKNRRKDRFAKGSLTLSKSVKLFYKLDDNQNPLQFFTYKQRDSNRLVEEYMLLANMLVAKQLIDFCPESALLRCHPDPGERGSRILATLSQAGYSINAQSSAQLHQSLARYADQEINGLNAQTLLENMCIKFMQLAQYFCSGTESEPRKWRHYALAFDFYTHFTSPIRRYADVLVHRLLTISLERMKHLENGGCLADFDNEKNLDLIMPPHLAMEAVATNCTNCNTRKKKAKNCSDQSAKVYLCSLINRLMEEHKERHGDEALFMEEAIIVDMGNNSFDVIVFRIGEDVRVHLDDIKAVKKEIISIEGEKHILRIQWTDDHEPQSYRVFDSLQVQIDLKRSPPPIDLIFHPIKPDENTMPFMLSLKNPLEPRPEGKMRKILSSQNKDTLSGDQDNDAESDDHDVGHIPAHTVEAIEDGDA